jgi:hypothetical protein
MIPSDIDTCIDLAMQDPTARAPVALFVYAARAAHRDDAAFAQATQRAVQFAFDTMQQEQGVVASMFGLTGALLTDARAVAKVLVTPGDTNAVLGQFRKGADALLAMASQYPERRASIRTIFDRMWHFAYQVMLPASQNPAPDSVVSSVLSTLDALRGPEMDKVEAAPAVDRLFARIREALDDAVERSGQGENPIRPFAMLWLASGMLTVSRASNPDPELALRAALDVVRRNREPLDSFCVVWLGTHDGKPALLIRAGRPERDSDLVVAQSYQTIAAGSGIALDGVLLVAHEPEPLT